MDYLQNLPYFAAYLLTALALLGAFIGIYVRVTPYREFALIRQGNVAAATSLLGAMLGFVLPVASAIAHSTGLLDMAVWGLVALVVQLVVYQVVVRLLPDVANGIAQGVAAHGVFLGGASLVVGVVNAACMTY